MFSFTDKELKKIIFRRDPKYDGRFYFGVKTTMIYCRPICPARPKPENILVFKSPAEAEVFGCRPCKRCKPDQAPGQKHRDEKYIIVSQALNAIENFDNSRSVQELANLQGVSDRHLRRLFQEYLGASPQEVINTRRLHLAKKFIMETESKVIDVAFSVGFNSLRRFNESFKQLYKMSPTTMRKSAAAKLSKEFISLRQMVRSPYDWNYVLNFLERHLIYGSEEIHGHKYRRYIFSEKNKGIKYFEVSFDEKKSELILNFYNLRLDEIRVLLPKIKNLFDVDHNPAFFSTRKNSHLSIRVPMCFDPYEVSVSIVLSQLISTQQAKKKLEFLVKKYGQRIHSEKELYKFPEMHDLACADLETIGMTQTKAHAIRELSQYFISNLQRLSVNGEIDNLKNEMLSIKGIGPWTVESIAMRCLGDANAFPASDLIVKRALQKKNINPEKWKGLRAYLCHLIWRDRVKELENERDSKVTQK